MGRKPKTLFHGGPELHHILQPGAGTGKKERHEAIYATSSRKLAEGYAYGHNDYSHIHVNRPKNKRSAALHPIRTARSLPTTRTKGYVHEISSKGFHGGPGHDGGEHIYTSKRGQHAPVTKSYAVKASRRETPLTRGEAKAGAAVIGGAAVVGTSVYAYRHRKQIQQHYQNFKSSHMHHTQRKI